MEDNKNHIANIEKTKEGNYDNDQIDWAQRRRIFYLIMYVNMLTNLDGGVVPVALLNIK